MTVRNKLIEKLTTTLNKRSSTKETKKLTVAKLREIKKQMDELNDYI